jgi:methionine-rich copper-binding protein CopC
MSHTRGNRSVRAALHAVLAAGLAFVGLATVAPTLPASAHSALISSNPAHESRLDNISDLGPTLLLRSGDETLTEFKPVIKGQTLSAAAPSETLAAGDYQLVWRVVSADGHPISGVIAFTLDTPADASATPAPTTSPTTSPAAPDSASNSDDSGSASNWIALAAVPAIAVIALLLLRRRPTSKENPS